MLVNFSRLLRFFIINIMKESHYAPFFFILAIFAGEVAHGGLDCETMFFKAGNRDVLVEKSEGLRAPSCHMSPETIFVGWERSLEKAKLLGHQYLIVPDFDDWTKQTLDDWRQWADRFNAAGAVARKADIWLAFHNEAYHQKPIDGKVPFDVFIERLDPSVTRLQLDVGNMLIGGGDPMQYLQKYPNRFWSFHLKDALPDRSSDTLLGKGMFDFKKFLAAVPAIEQKPAYVEQETAKDAAGDLADARANFEYLHNLEF